MAEDLGLVVSVLRPAVAQAERFRLFHPGGWGHGVSASDQARSGRIAMTDDKSRRVEVKDEDQTIAAAEVTPLDNSEGTAP